MQKDGNGQLIYSEHLDRFCRRGSVEDKHTSALYDQGVDIQRFLVKNNVVYGINNDFQLWSYNLR
ncbi:MULTISPECIES: hypothetical protein [unclassified Pseudoalteromonas]|uniref:hypothetical protein n=1 Tax=unclassified Pseudoalteromonas TaxID=194690 RepID=UPI0005A70978|nr:MULTISPECIES: hypothetical protein [unclassified Pseudoalteromonas]